MRYRMLLIFSIGLFLNQETLLAQSIRYGAIFDTAVTVQLHSIAGSLHNQVLVLTQPVNETPLLSILDTNGNQKSVVKLESPAFPSAVPIQFFPGNDEILAFSQKRIDNKVYHCFVRINENGAIPNSYQLVDSSRIDLLNGFAYFLQSFSKVTQSILLYRMIPNRVSEKLLVDFIRLDKRTTLIDKGTMQIPFSLGTQEMSNVFEHSSGEALFAIYKRPDNFSLLSDMRVYRFTSNPKKEFLVKLSFKGITPGTPVFASNSSPEILTVASTYFEQYSVMVDGIQVTTANLRNAATEQKKELFPFQKNPNNGPNASVNRIRIDNRALYYRYINLLNCYYLNGSDNINVLMEAHYQLAPSQYTDNGSGGNSFPENNSSANTVSNLTPSQNLGNLRNYVRSLDNLTSPLTPRYGGLSNIAPPTNLSGVGAFTDFSSSFYNDLQLNNPILNNNHNVFERPSRLEHIVVTVNPSLVKAGQEKLRIKIGAGINGQSTARMILDKNALLFNFNTNGSQALVFQQFGLNGAVFQKELPHTKGMIPFYNNAVCQISSNAVYCLYYVPSQGVGLSRVEWR